jgi:hypothetical protein
MKAETVQDWIGTALILIPFMLLTGYSLFDWQAWVFLPIASTGAAFITLAGKAKARREMESRRV